MPNLSTADREQERLKVLHRYRILDSGPEQDYDDIATLASYICQTPIALITMVDERRQWFKANVGLAGSETSREVAFCAHTILGDGPMIVTDTQLDSRFQQNPLVLGDPHIRFYAGVPLMVPGQLAVGSLCVIDRQPRTLTPEQLAALAALARQVSTHLELRLTSARLADALDQVQTLSGLIPICSYCEQIRSDAGYWQQLEGFLHTHTGAEFSHGICPPCYRRAEAAVPLGAPQK